MSGRQPFSDAERIAARRASRKRWARANPEKDKARWKRRDVENRERRNAQKRALNAKNKVRIKAQAAARYAANRTKFQSRSAAWRKVNRRRVIAGVRAWEKANPEAVRARDARRRARCGSSKSNYTANDVRALFMLQRHRCAICMVSIRRRYEIDHIVPLARNGSNDRGNIQLLCPPCNRMKGAKDPLVFAQQLGLLL